MVPQEAAAEAVECVTLALDKYIATKNYEAAAKVMRVGRGSLFECVGGGLDPLSLPSSAPLPFRALTDSLPLTHSQTIKDSMDRKFGNMWHCCIGEVRANRRQGFSQTQTPAHPSTSLPHPPPCSISLSSFFALRVSLALLSRASVSLALFPPPPSALSLSLSLSLPGPSPHVHLQRRRGLGSTSRTSSVT